MSKKAYLFVTGSALLSLVGVSLAEAPSFLLEAAEPASYTKSVTLTGAMLQTNRSHSSGFNRLFRVRYCPWYWWFT